MATLGTGESSILLIDLLLDYCCESSRTHGTTEAWRRRLLNGHLSVDICIPNNMNEAFHMKVLEYTARRRWRDDIPNVLYVRRNICRHLHEAGLNLELAAVVLDVRWIGAQARTGGILALRSDFELLSAVIGTDRDIACSDKHGPEVLEASLACMGREIRLFSFILLSALFATSKTDQFLDGYL